MSLTAIIKKRGYQNEMSTVGGIGGMVSWRGLREESALIIRFN